MTRAGIVFLIVVIINCLVAAAYLLWYLIFKQDQDNRKQYIMHTVIMVLWPKKDVSLFNRNLTKEKICLGLILYWRPRMIRN